MHSAKTDKSIWYAVAIVAASTIVRAFLEFFSNPESGGGLAPWFVTLNYFLCFLAIIIGLGIIIGIATRESWNKWIFIAAKYSPIILLAPIIDLIASHGQGICMAYLGSGGSLLIRDFLQFFGPFGNCGITIGMRIEILIVLVAMGWLIWRKTSSIFRTIATIIASYIFIFLNGAIPGIFAIFSPNFLDAGTWIMGHINQSMLATTHSFGASEDLRATGAMMFSMFTARVHFLTIIILGAIAWFHESKNSLQSWIGNARPERILYYVAIMGAGILFAIQSFNVRVSWVDVIGLLVAIISVTANFWAAVASNDIADKKADAIEYPDRPLSNGMLREEQFQNMRMIFLTTSIIGALLINYAFVFFMIAYQLLAIAYSSPQIRWKKNFVSASITLAAIAAFTFLAGYYFASPDQAIATFPILPLLAGFIGMAIISNVKDFRSRRGDAADGVKTIPVLMGTKNAVRVVTTGIITWNIVVGIIFREWYFFAVAAVFAIIVGIGIKRKIPEWVMFGVFVGCVIGGVIIL